ncbi:uncharacterized protein MYCFIDRAFT_84042 [Pseudocercospora fijiensis CIRAD86]|uniref:Uncharacterized protein n=1 Tax=Pseudocercospora fijiensis (strain CIRAD86) TaxID=383855 RepID=M2ZZB5_PSEFD|nr:uncharacterized protein MYCFIDRAFT_84042 [Pseudocercospora fijiensis CIRAD86]EME77506.1 hypothetical protein MYCFIDRAFT_84042 [Pseudocercospora fijiensis CIRAD86]
MGKSNKATTWEQDQYLQAFAGLTVNQLKSQATDEPDGVFKFSANEKALALQHAVKNVYTDKVPPPINVFIHLVTGVIPVPIQYGLDATEACLEGVRRLIMHVIAEATKQGLVHSEDVGNGVWKVHVSTHLINWDGTGGWKAIKKPSLFPEGPVQQNEFASYQKLVPNATSAESWATLIKMAMHHFAATANSQVVAQAANTMITPRVLAAPTTALAGITNTPATTSTYRPSNFTDQPTHEQDNQMNAYYAFRRFLGRHNIEARHGVAPPAHVLKTFAWNGGNGEKQPGHDYVNCFACTGGRYCFLSTSVRHYLEREILQSLVYLIVMNINAAKATIEPGITFAVSHEYEAKSEIRRPEYSIEMN